MGGGGQGQACEKIPSTIFFNLLFNENKFPTKGYLASASVRLDIFYDFVGCYTIIY